MAARVSEHAHHRAASPGQCAEWCSRQGIDQADAAVIGQQRGDVVSAPELRGGRGNDARAVMPVPVPAAPVRPAPWRIRAGDRPAPTGSARSLAQAVRSPTESGGPETALEPPRSENVASRRLLLHVPESEFLVILREHAQPVSVAPEHQARSARRWPTRAGSRRRGAPETSRPRREAGGAARARARTARRPCE